MVPEFTTVTPQPPRPHVFLSAQTVTFNTLLSLRSQGAAQTPYNMHIEPLTRAEVETLSDPDRRYFEAAAALERKNTSAKEDLTSFEYCLKIKVTLDEYEQRARTKPSWSVLAVLINGEHRLWCLNAQTPIRVNPFLSHWVEAFQRMGRISAAKDSYAPASTASGGITTQEIFTVRTEWIKTLLRSKSKNENIALAPRVLHHACVRLGQISAFDIQTYVRMLEETGIYDKAHKLPTVPAEPPKAPAAKRTKEQPHNNASKQWKEDMLRRLNEQPDAAVQELTHLPLELPYLDFFTTLLTNRTLESLAIEPAPVITSYIQHSLRLIEKMAEPPTGADVDGDTNGSNYRWEYGKEAQSRLVRILLLFIKSLIRKELLGTEVLYFEIQEICVRYVWIKEVRDFRSWVEEGVGEEEVRGP
ncbi:hypothetical protein N0V83_001458 [Neocucurbitaria cava]|uniref:CCR4-NOT transcription complex subunit 11 n=1 Tax=Neocucurbitaria cava TaxID=798079 RepID=A0A9W9CQE8_9PLEO|nr:hypothetical protein N0V83_001458 [Neocucurbitaria cava]